MTNPDYNLDFQQQVLTEFRGLREDVEGVKEDIEGIREDLEGVKEDLEGANQDLKAEIGRFNDRFSDYQQATQWVVQLAFTLIASATITVIVTSIFKR